MDYFHIQDKYKHLRLITTNLAQRLVFHDASLWRRCGWFYLKAICLRMIKLIKSSKEMDGKHKSTRKKKLLKYYSSSVACNVSYWACHRCKIASNRHVRSILFYKVMPICPLTITNYSFWCFLLIRIGWIYMSPGLLRYISIICDDR